MQLSTRSLDLYTLALQPVFDTCLKMSFITESESRVLVIYTGGDNYAGIPLRDLFYPDLLTTGWIGTIGMLVGESGYVPEPFFLTEFLRSQSRFHDPQGYVS